MLTVGDRFPAFRLTAVTSREKGKAFQPMSDQDYSGKWKVYFFWPKDFTFVCPTEIAEFGRRSGEFAERGAQVIGCSTDSDYVHLAWRNDHPDLRELPIPMLSDIKRELTAALGILHPAAGVATRATFLVDPEGTIRWCSASDLKVGRSVDEVLRVLDGFQTGELCPVNWKKGEAVLKP